MCFCFVSLPAATVRLAAVGILAGIQWLLMLSVGWAAFHVHFASLSNAASKALESRTIVRVEVPVVTYK